MTAGLVATVDAANARVRLTATDLAVLNTNSDFETNVTGWVGVNGTIARSTAFAYQGTASALLTPSGSAVDARIEPQLAQSVPGSGDDRFFALAWVYSPAGWVGVNISLCWMTSAGVVQTVTNDVSMAIPAGKWTRLTTSGTVPLGSTTTRVGSRVRITGTPGTTNVLYVDELIVAPLGTLGAWYERSTDGGTTWFPLTETYVDLVAGDNQVIDDYQYSPGVPNWYRVRITSSDIGTTNDQTLTAGPVTPPAVDAVWLKATEHPELNRTINVVDFSDVERPTRGGVFDVLGRSLPIAVSDVRGSRRYTLDVLAEDDDEAAELEAILATGDTVLLQVPPDCPVPAMHAEVGDVTVSRTGRRANRRVFSLPLTEVAPPHATWAPQ